MKKLFFLILMFILIYGLEGNSIKEIAANTKHVGNIKIKAGNFKIREGAEFKGNIFIEEGDLFIFAKVTMQGTITIKKGKIRIGKSTKLKGNIFIEEGDLFCEEDFVMNGGGAISIKKGNITAGADFSFKGDIQCRNGKFTMGENGDIRGAIYAKAIKQGKNCKISKGFHKVK